MSETIKPGRYRHFKGKEYEVLGVARHSETNEVIERDGKTYRRFTYIGEGDA